MKKTISLLLVLSCTLPGMGFAAKGTTRDTSQESEGQMRMVIGERLENPYSVENMQEAFDFYNRHVSRSPFINRTVTATHRYIQINPTTEAHLEELEAIDASQSDSMILHDYPLDYEVVQEGDFYVQPQDETDLYHPVYTVIPNTERIGLSVPYVVLEELYQPTEAEYDVETVSLIFAGWHEDAECGAARHCSDTAELVRVLNESSTERGRLFGRRYRPNGYVMIENTEVAQTNPNNAMEPLRRAKISIGRSIWWRYTYTDDNGYFSSPKKYRGKVRIRAKWRSSTATIRKSWNEMLGLWVSDHLMTLTRGSNGRTKYIPLNTSSNNEHLWYKGTVHNGLVKYNDFAHSNGIDEPVSGANVWVWKNGDNSGAAPMMNHYRHLHLLASLAGIGQSQVWDVVVNALSAFLIDLLPGRLRPDQIYSGLKHRNDTSARVNTAEIEQLVFHESAHYSHAVQTSAWYWAKLVSAEIANLIATLPDPDPYRDGSQPSFTAGKHIALAEGWATLVEFHAMADLYGRAEDNGVWQFNPLGYIDNFNMYTVPMAFGTDVNDDWFLTGLFQDVVDNVTDSSTQFFDGQTAIPEGPIVDNLHIQDQGELYPIFNLLQSDVYTACDYGAALVDTYPDGQDIEDLFHSYGFTCVDGNGGGGIGVDPTSPPATPANFSITTYGGGPNLLDWAPMAQTDVYEVHEGNSPSGSFTLATTINAPASSWMAHVISNTYYKVRGCNIIGCSSFTPARLAYYQQCGNPPLPPCE